MRLRLNLFVSHQFRYKRFNAFRLRLIWIALLWASLSPATAYTPSTDPSTPESFAWTQIVSNHAADFNEFCHATLNPSLGNGWDDPCRQLSAAFVSAIFTDQVLKSQVGINGLRIVGASIVGDVDAHDAEVPFTAALLSGRVYGDVFFSHTHFKHSLSLSGFFDPRPGIIALDGADMMVDSDLQLGNAEFGGQVFLVGAKVLGIVDFSSSKFRNLVNLYNIEVAKDILIWKQSVFDGQLYLDNSKIGGSIQFSDPIFRDDVYFRSAKIEKNLLFLDGVTALKSVNLTDLRVSGKLDIVRGYFQYELRADRMDIHENADILASTFTDGASFVGTRANNEFN